MRATHIVAFLDILMPNRPLSRSSDTLEEAANNWLSAVDMVLARIPASTRPATSAKPTPCLLSRSAILMMADSASDCEPKVTMAFA